MKEFKKIMAQSHTQNKDCLHYLYTDKQVYISSLSSSEQPIEDAKIYEYRGISFTLEGTGFREPQRMILYVWVPEELLGSTGELAEEYVPCEDWLLRSLAGPVNALAKDLQNDHKDAREKPNFSLQETDSVIRRRSGCLYMRERREFRLRIAFQFPLIGGHSVNGKSGYRGMKMLLDAICDCLERADRESLREQLQLYRRQTDIRRFLKETGLLVFVADGSILPRQGDTQMPLYGAVPFHSPESLRVSIPLGDGTELTGMGIKRGITVITGGGYGGKSTLLDALEQGIYFHVKGDGREYVITEETACKIYAEDGRCVQPTDLSPFFSYLPGEGGIHAFSTVHASGSVSQAVNIVEAVYSGSRLLLIDEDTSATNFMIRDRLMRQLVRREPIVPYTDRIRELSERDISTILVIGGSGEYLQYADCVLLLEDYQVYDKTLELRELLACGNSSDNKDSDERTHRWTEWKSLPSTFRLEQNTGYTVQFDHERRISLGEITADLTRLTALEAPGQLYTLAWLLEMLLTQDWQQDEDLKSCCERLVQNLFEDSRDVVLTSRTHQYELQLEEVRCLDLLLAAFRLRKP
ncbi:MAG: ABC-ATPase domain-containing protein [bacterium]|nr:ABC-ATPase domain-containing protein [bacterium]MCM1373960.1 ABC-ATPase domain-containing protein [Muribaculum sp.]